MKRRFKITCYVLLTVIVMVGLNACAPSAYICPLPDLPGKCCSQMDAYKATLRNKADRDSIFCG